MPRLGNICSSNDLHVSVAWFTDTLDFFNSSHLEAIFFNVLLWAASFKRFDSSRCSLGSISLASNSLASFRLPRASASDNSGNEPKPRQES